MSIQSNIDYHAQALADRALSAKDPKIVQSILGNLTKSIQDGAVKPYVGIPLVQTINQHLQGLSQQAAMMQAAAPAPQVPPQGSIGAGIMQQAQAETSPGIAAAPSGLPTQYASGGIVAFDDGGEVEGYEKGGLMDAWKKYQSVLADPNLESGESSAWQRLTQPTSKSIYDLAKAQELARLSNLPGPGMFQVTTPQEREAYAKRNQLIRQFGAGEFDPQAAAAPTAPGGTEDTGRQERTAAFLANQARQQLKDPEYLKLVGADKKPAKEKGPTPAAETTAETTAPTTQAPTADPYDKYLQDLMSKSESDRAGLKQLILGDEAERAKGREQDLWTQLLGAGFKMMGGTSPYAMANIGAAGEEMTKGIAQIQAKEDAAKQQRISQLVNLGLKGTELDTQLAHLGITAKEAKSNADYRQAMASAIPSEIALRAAQREGILKGDIPYKQAMAEYTKAGRGKSGTAGMGSVSSSVVQQELNALEGYRAQPATAPFFKQLPTDVQVALTKTDPKSGSYQRAMKEFNNYAEQYVQGRLNVMRAYGAKQPQIYSGLPE